MCSASRARNWRKSDEFILLKNIGKSRLFVAARYAVLVSVWAASRHWWCNSYISYLHVGLPCGDPHLQHVPMSLGSPVRTIPTADDGHHLAAPASAPQGTSDYPTGITQKRKTRYIDQSVSYQRIYMRYSYSYLVRTYYVPGTTVQ